MARTIESSVRLVRDLEVEIAAARNRIDGAWREIRAASQVAALRRGRRKNVERNAAEKARTHKLCRKAGLLELSGIIDEDDAVLVGLFLAAKEVIQKPDSREAWRRRGEIKLLKRAKGKWPILVIRFEKQPPAFVLEKLSEDGFEYQPRRTQWMGEANPEYGTKLIALSGVGGRVLAEPAGSETEPSR